MQEGAYLQMTAEQGAVENEPMTLREIADELGLSIQQVNRIANTMFPRSAIDRFARWELTPVQAQAGTGAAESFARGGLGSRNRLVPREPFLVVAKSWVLNSAWPAKPFGCEHRLTASSLVSESPGMDLG